MREQANPQATLSSIPGLPPESGDVLNDLISKSRECLGADLISIVLYGSAAEGRLSPTSDINILYVLTCFQQNGIDPLRQTLRTAYSAARVKPMFILGQELAPAADAFSLKFADMADRHLVLYGADPFDSIEISREARINRLKTVLLNIAIRLRERYVATSLRPEQMAAAMVEAAGPLRVAAASILSLQGKPATSPISTS